MAYELIIKNQVGSIQWDPNGLQQYVEGMIQKYDGLIFTDEEIPEAKKRMADLNRLKKNIEDKRKEIKKEIAEPYMQFEAQIKPIVQRIDEVRGKIDVQVKDYERIRDEKKQKEIQDWWAANGTKGVSIQLVWDPRYLNVTFTMDQVIQDLKAKKEKNTENLALICNMAKDNPVQADFMIEDFTKHLSVQQALENWQKLEDARIRAEQIKAEREASRIAAEQARAAESAKDPEPAPAIQPERPAPKPQQISIEQASRHWSITFRVEGSHEDMVALGNYMNSLKPNGFKYYVIEREEK